MSELTQSMGMLRAKFPSCIQQIDHPTHNGKPNPFHGHYFIVGSVPASCIDHESGRRRAFTTVDQAIAALKEAGVARCQLPDCSWRDIATV